MKRFLPKSIAKTAIVAALSGSLALSPMTATPAHAGNEDAAAVAAASFFALITAGIIANAAKNNHGGWTVDRRDQRPDRGNHGNNRRKILPSKCELVVRRGPDRGTYYGRRCLRNNYNYVASLPDRCLDKVWVPRRDRNVNAYDAQCLSRFGYREEGTRGPRTSRR